MEINRKRLYIVLGFAGFVAIGVFLFNRNPKRIIPSEGSLLSPADGIIKSIVNNRIEIFIQITDVHIQRVPCDSLLRI